MDKKRTAVGILSSAIFGATILFVIHNEYANRLLAKKLDILVLPINLLMALVLGSNDKNLNVFLIADVVYMFALGFLFGYYLRHIYQRLKTKWAPRLPP